ncbi:unnamed protein product, partial [Rotaria magnacalcarata]
MLTWFTGVMDKCVYKLSIVECPRQRSMSEDRLLHSYLNATACQWAADNKCWKALRDNFYRQKFSSRENIEKLKKWFIEDNLNEFVCEIDENVLLNDKTIEIIEKFRSIVKPIIRRYLNPEKRLELEEIKEYVNSLSKLFTSVKTFGDLAETINHINRNENQQEIEKSIDEIRKTTDNLEEKHRELLEINAYVDVMFEILKQTYSKLLFTYQTMNENFENFGDKLHHTILLSLFEKNLLVT